MRHRQTSVHPLICKRGPINRPSLIERADIVGALLWLRKEFVLSFEHLELVLLVEAQRAGAKSDTGLELVIAPVCVCDR